MCGPSWTDLKTSHVSLILGKLCLKIVLCKEDKNFDRWQWQATRCQNHYRSIEWHTTPANCPQKYTPMVLCWKHNTKLQPNKWKCQKQADKTKSLETHCSPLNAGERALSGDCLWSGDLLFLWTSPPHCWVGDADGLLFFTPVGLDPEGPKPNDLVAFMGPCLVDGDGIRRTLWEPWLAIMQIKPRLWLHKMFIYYCEEVNCVCTQYFNCKFQFYSPQFHRLLKSENASGSWPEIPQAWSRGPQTDLWLAEQGNPDEGIFQINDVSEHLIGQKMGQPVRCPKTWAQSVTKFY